MFPKLLPVPSVLSGLSSYKTLKKWGTNKGKERQSKRPRERAREKERARGLF